MNLFPNHFTSNKNFSDAPPNAYAMVNGNKTYPEISGIVRFYDIPYKGIILTAEFFHLPLYSPSDIPSFYGFHLHENGDCSQNFANTGGHYNPKKQPHPYHAGEKIACGIVEKWNI